MKTANKVLVTAVVGAAVFGATQGQVHAEEVKPEFPKSGVETESSVKKVTAEEVTSAQDKVTDLQKQKETTEKANDKTVKQLDAAQREKSIVESKVKEYSKVTPEDVEVSKTEVANAETTVSKAQTEKSKVDTKVNNAKADLTVAKNTQADKENAVNTAKQAARELKTGTTNVQALEQEKAGKVAERDKVQVAKVAGESKVKNTQIELDDAKQADATHATKLVDARDKEQTAKVAKDTSKRELEASQTEQEKAEKALDDARGGNILHEIKLPKGYIATNPLVMFDKVKKELGDTPEIKDVDENDTSKGYTVVADVNPGTVYKTIDEANDALDRAWDAYNTKYTEVYMKYINKSYLEQEVKYRDEVNEAISAFYEKHKVSDGNTVWNWNSISRKNREDLTVYAVNLLNSMRAQLGKGPVKANGFMTQFGDEAGKVRVRDNYKVTNHYGKGINEVARNHGMLTSAEPGVDTTKQLYENLTSHWTVGPDQYDNTHITKQEMYEKVAQYMVGFLMEGSKVRDYGHFSSLVERDDFHVGLGFSAIGSHTFMGVYDANPAKSDYFEGALGEESKQKLLNSDLPLGKDTSALEEAVRVARETTSQKQASYDQAVAMYNTAKTNLDALSNYTSNVASLESKLAEAKSEVANATAKINTLTSEIDALTTRIDNANASEEKRQTALRDAETKLAEAQASYNEATAKVKEAESKLTNAQADQAKAQTKVEDAKVKLTQAQNTLSKKQTALANLVSEQQKLQSLTAEINRLVDEKASQETTLTNLHTKLVEAVKEYNRLVLRYQIENQVLPAVEPELPEFPLDKVPTYHNGDEDGKPWIQPALPEFPILEVPRLVNPADGLLEMPIDEIPDIHAREQDESLAVGTSTTTKISNDYFVGTKGERKLPNTGVDSTATTGLGLFALVGGLFASKRRKEN